MDAAPLWWPGRAQSFVRDPNTSPRMVEATGLLGRDRQRDAGQDQVRSSVSESAFAFTEAIPFRADAFDS